MKASATALLKWLAKITREILVEWANLGKERPRPAETDLEDGDQGDPLPLELAGAAVLGGETQESLGPREEGAMEEALRNHALGLFDQAEFQVLDQNDVNRAYADIPTPIDIKDFRPDLLFRHKGTGIKFGVVLGLHRRLELGASRGQVKVLEGYRRRRLLKYSQQSRVPCFVILGVGAESIERLALIPLENIPPEGLGLKVIARYDRDPDQPITFMELAELSALCNQLALEKKEGSAAVLEP